VSPALQPDENRATLAERLRDLRLTRWPGRSVQQQELAKALGVGNTSVSMWERRANPTVPPPGRLADIATFYATRRSLANDTPRLLSGELTTDEQAECDRLLAELTALRAAATSTAPGPTEWNPWRFPDGGQIRLVCGALPPSHRSTYADEDDHNFMALSAYADLDALVDLYGHLRAENPRSDIQYRLVSELTAEDLRSHLVVLGNLAWLQDRRSVLGNVGVPVRQVRQDSLDGEVFEVVRTAGAEAELLTPTFARTEGDRVLVEDIGLIVRRPSPLVGNRTLSLCSGVFTRGVLGAVRALTDRGVREANLGWLADRFRTATTYGLLFRVRVHGRHVVTPELADPRCRLLEFEVEPD
jgi:transcriptional regulator with XRE-family HTH domain